MQNSALTNRTIGSKIRRDFVGIATSIVVMVSGVSTSAAQTIRVVSQPGNTSAVPFAAALKQGYFKDAGLDVTYVTMGGGGTPVSAALKAAEVDVSLGGAFEHLADIARGVVPGKLIGELTDNNYLVVGGNGITDIKQLKGKVIGISGYNAGDHLYLQTVLAHYGIGPDDVTYLPVGIPSSRLAALANGQVDAIELALTAIPEKDKHRIIMGVEDSPVPFISLGIFVRQNFLTSNKPALRKFLLAIGKGAEWTKAHPDDAVAICVDTGAKADDCKLAIQVATTSKNPYTWSSTARLNGDAVKEMISIIAALVPKAKDMTVADFADLSIAEGGPQ
jgi:NitT/TauT family transport system substrate-binding protein